MDPTQIYAIIKSLSAIIAVIVLLVAFTRKASPGAIPLTWLMAAVAVWAVTSALEMTAHGETGKIFWSKMGYLGIMTAPVFFYWFASQYNRKTIPAWFCPILIAFPLIGIILVFTNEFHYLIWSGLNMIPGTNILKYDHGVLFWVLIPGIYSLLVMGIFIFINSAIQNKIIYRKQTWIVIASSIFPIAGNLLYISGNSPFPGMDTTPIGFTITGIFLTWGLFQYRLLDIIPVGRDAVIEDMTDGMIITDFQNRILDYNQAALENLDLKQKPVIGDHIQLHFPEIISSINGAAGNNDRKNFEVSRHHKVLDVKKMPLLSGNKKVVGYSFFISDITTKKNAENSLRESEERSRQLLDNASFPLMICDLGSGSIIYRNKWASSLLHFPPVNGQDISLADLFCDTAEFRRLSVIIQKNRFVTDYETRVHSSNNIDLWVLFSANIIAYANEEAILVSFNDITSRKLMEEAEKEQRQFNEAMIDSASALNSTLDFDEVLDRILTNLEKVIPHHVANIMLVTEGGEVKIVRAHGYDAKGLKILFQNGEMPVSETPYLLKMAMHGKPIVIADTHADPVWVNLPGMEKTRSYLGAPIFVKGQIMGFINVESFDPHDYNKNHAKRLMAFADQAALAIENSRLFEKLEQMAVVDTLTGLYTRRHFFELGEKEVERARRYDSPLTILMIDLDYFKKINDTFGHAIGDQVLRDVAEGIASTLRKIDIPGRIGGEEFVVMLPETNEQNGLIVANRLRQAIEKIKIPIENEIMVNVTASFGLSTLHPSHSNLQALIASADMAMYLAKENGRNRVEISIMEK